MHRATLYEIVKNKEIEIFELAKEAKELMARLELDSQRRGLISKENLETLRSVGLMCEIIRHRIRDYMQTRELAENNLKEVDYEIVG